MEELVDIELEYSPFASNSFREKGIVEESDNPTSIPDDVDVSGTGLTQEDLNIFKQDNK